MLVAGEAPEEDAAAGAPVESFFAAAGVAAAAAFGFAAAAVFGAAAAAFAGAAFAAGFDISFQFKTSFSALFFS